MDGQEQNQRVERAGRKPLSNWGRKRWHLYKDSSRGGWNCLAFFSLPEWLWCVLLMLSCILPCSSFLTHLPSARRLLSCFHWPMSNTPSPMPFQRTLAFSPLSSSIDVPSTFFYWVAHLWCNSFSHISAWKHGAIVISLQGHHFVQCCVVNACYIT